MQSPISFNAQRSELEALCSQVNSLALHSYQTASLMDSSQGAVLLANAIQDTSRTQRPDNWHAVVLYATANKAELLASQLLGFNAVCPLKALLEAQRFTDSLTSLEQHKMQVPKGYEQSLEWQVLDDCRAVPALSNAFNDASLALVNDEGTSLITSIDDALSELTVLKSNRDERLTNTKFAGQSLDIKMANFTGNNASGLANSIKQLGDNNMHWVFLVFVGSSNEIKPIKELFI